MQANQEVNGGNLKFDVVFFFLLKDGGANWNCLQIACPPNTATNLTPSSHTAIGFLILLSKFRNRAMLYDETLIEVFDTDVGF